VIRYFCEYRRVFRLLLTETSKKKKTETDAVDIKCRDDENKSLFGDLFVSLIYFPLLVIFTLFLFITLGILSTKPISPTK
jgi:hypothetical protein